jgi:cell shape-determining protein MreC
LNDLLAFKQKYQQLEEENRHLKRQSKYTSTDLTKLSPIMDKSVNNNVGASLDDYEKLLYQMRGNRY